MTYRISVLTIALVSCFGLLIGLSRFASSQIQDPKKPTSNSNSNTNSVPTFDDVSNAYPKLEIQSVVTDDSDDSDDSDQYSMKWLRHDLRISDLVVYVNVIEKKLIDHTDGADCDNDKGTGYCAYLLTASVNEVFKGKIIATPLEFVETPDADYPKRFLLGKQVVFLTRGERVDGREARFQTLENSTRRIEHNVIQKLRNVLDPSSIINETDEKEPYSLVAIRKSFEEAEAVAYVNVIGFRPNRDQTGETEEIVKAVVIEGFKGKLKRGQKVEFREDFLYRQHRTEDLGEQVVYLTPSNLGRYAYKSVIVDPPTGKGIMKDHVILETAVLYENEQYTEAFIKHNILGKLRVIAAEDLKSR